jgi:hypothetical protein
MASTPLGGDLDFLQYEALNLKFQTLTTDPGGFIIGMSYMNSADLHFRLHNGSGFQIIPFVTAATPTALTVGGAAAVGSDLDAARAGHAHAMPGLATISAAGFMSAADKTDLTNATPSPTASTLMKRDAAGRTQAADPVAAQDLVTLAFFNAAFTGRDSKESVRVKSTGNVNIANPGTAIFDTITLAALDRILLASQTAPAENGIYQFNGAGTAMTRTADADSWAELVGAYVIVEQGSANADTGWLCLADQGGTLGTTAVNWGAFGNATSYSAANAAGITGVAVLNGTIGTQFQFRAIKAGSTKLSCVLTGTDIVVDVVEANILLPNLGGTLPISKGGTGATTAVAARAALGATGKATATIGDGVTTVFVINHGLGTTDVTVEFWEVSTKRKWVIPVENTDVNNVTARFGRPPAAGAFRVVMIG